MRQIEEQVQALDERGGERGGGHAVDEAGGAGGEQVDGAEQHPAAARLLRRLDLQELGDAVARRLCATHKRQAAVLRTCTCIYTQFVSLLLRFNSDTRTLLI